mmetsp:Transcript_132619/g.330774  ORF Transcript_132619/g.330774 Transcript_132619/m.330774 type:complete len:454 (-) Transcript_132619:567-1928(-)
MGHHHVRDEHPNIVAARSHLQPVSDMNIRRQVRGIDFVLAADRSLDGPTHMKSEAHLHLEARHPLQQTRMLAPRRQHARLVDLGEDLDEGHDGHIRELRLPLGRQPGEPPDDHEGVAYILVGRSVVVVGAAVHDLADLVHKDHDPFTKDLRRMLKVPDGAETENGIDLYSGSTDVDAGAARAVGEAPDDLGAGLAEAEGEEAPELDDGLLEHDGLHGLLNFLHVLVLVEEAHAPPHLCELFLPASLLDLLPPVLQVAEAHGLERIVLDGFHLGDHSLDGVEEELVGVLGEGHRPKADCEADEDRLQHAEPGLECRGATNVESEEHVEVKLLTRREPHRRSKLPLGAPELRVRRATRDLECGNLRLDRHADEGGTPLQPGLRDSRLRRTTQRKHGHVPASWACEAQVPFRLRKLVWPNETLLIELHEVAQVILRYVQAIHQGNPHRCVAVHQYR